MMNRFKSGFTAAAIVALSLASAANAAWVSGPRFSLNSSYYVLNNVSGVVSICFLNAATRASTCSTAGTFPNVTAQTQVQTQENSGVAWIRDAGSGRIMRCALTFAASNVISGATCSVIAPTLP